MKTKDITKIAILTSICVVISIIESYFTFIGDIIPGLKLGLANIVIIFTLYEYNFKTAITVSLVRVLIVALLRTGFGINFFFSLSGAIFSIIAMYLFKKYVLFELSQKQARLFEQYEQLKNQYISLLDKSDLDELLMYDNFKEKNNKYINEQTEQYSKYWNKTLLVYFIIFTFLTICT